MKHLVIEQHKRSATRWLPLWLVVVGFLATAFGLSYVSVAHEARRLQAEVCQAKLETHQARTRLRINGYLLPADPCRALAAVEGK